MILVLVEFGVITVIESMQRLLMSFDMDEGQYRSMNLTVFKKMIRCYKNAIKDQC